MASSMQLAQPMSACERYVYTFYEGSMSPPRLQTLDGCFPPHFYVRSQNHHTGDAWCSLMSEYSC